MEIGKVERSNISGALKIGNSIVFKHLLCLVFSFFGREILSAQNHQRPNILLIVADDLGYADLGCYGGDMQTPNIDALAARGVRFSRFHTSPLCAPTRAMLLTGTDHHIAGMGVQSRQNKGLFYEGKLTNRIVTIPALLKANGYHTFMAGKWHLGDDSTSSPLSKGFDRSFVNLEGAGNHYDDQSLFKANPKTPYLEDGKPASWKNGDYSTDFFTDKIISYIDQNKADGKPFFCFAAYTSPHWPLQVDEKYWKKYQGRYDEGYEKLKENRLVSLKKAGMIPQNAVLPPNHARVKAWDSLSEDEKKKEARKMELYAGMVDNLDYNVGRIIAYLEKIGQLDNTIILFMGDNGAAAEDFYNDEEYGAYIRQHFNEDYDNMGRPTSFISYGPQWAEAGSAPFRHFKGLTTEGGIIAPMIVTAPGMKQKNQIDHGFVSLLDIAPSFYEWAKVSYPASFEGNAIYPLKGNSMVPYLNGNTKQIHDNNYVFGLEHGNIAMVRKGDWKIVNIKKPFAEENFELYNLATDLAELNDLKDKEPKKYTEMLQEWKKFSEEVRVQLPPK